MPVPTENSPVSDSDLGNHHEPHDVAATGRPTVCHRPHPSRGAGRANRSWSVSDNHAGNHYSFKSLALTVLVPWSVAPIVVAKILVPFGRTTFRHSCGSRNPGVFSGFPLSRERRVPKAEMAGYQPDITFDNCYDIFNVLKVKGITLGNRYRTRYCCVFCCSASASAIAALIRDR